jgi:hypothetical protein
VAQGRVNLGALRKIDRYQKKKSVYASHPPHVLGRILIARSLTIADADGVMAVSRPKSRGACCQEERRKSHERTG